MKPIHFYPTLISLWALAVLALCHIEAAAPVEIVSIATLTALYAATVYHWRFQISQLGWNARRLFYALTGLFLALDVLIIIYLIRK